MIRLEGLAKAFGGPAPLRDVSLTVPPGDCVMLAGPSGSGKTTLLRLIAGFEVPDAGTIRLGDRTVTGPGLHVPPEERGVSMVFQGLALWPHMTVRRHLEFVLHGLASRDRAHRRDELIRQFEIDHRAAAFPSKLSGGEQQRLAIARGIAIPAPVLLLDEPLRNLDEELTARIVAVLAEHRKRTGATLLIATQQRAALSGLASRTVTIENGVLVEKEGS